MNQGARTHAAASKRQPPSTSNTTDSALSATGSRSDPTSEPAPEEHPGAYYEPPRSTATDDELLAAHVARSDPGAFTELTRRHRSRLWSVAGAILRNPQDADDAVQDAMLRAFTHAKTFRAESSVYVWLRTLTVNASITLAAKRTRLARRTTGHDPSFTPDRSAGAAIRLVELDELVRQVLSELPDDQRGAFVMVQLLDLPVAQVAELQMVQPATIYTRVHRARLHLVTSLDYRQVLELLRHLDP